MSSHALEGLERGAIFCRTIGVMVGLVVFLAAGGPSQLGEARAVLWLYPIWAAYEIFFAWAKSTADKE